MSFQKTRYGRFQNSVGSILIDSWQGTWRRRSLAMITLLIGYYLGSNATMYYLQKIGQRPIVVLLMVIVIELLIRSRNFGYVKRLSYIRLSIDNLRIGAVYAVVLEAFKLGS